MSSKPFNPWKRFNGIFVPLGVLTYSSLSDGAKLMFGRLSLYAGKEGVCYAFRDTIAEDMGIPLGTVARQLTELEEAGFIRRVQRGRGRPAAIEFLYHPALTGSEKSAGKAIPEMREQKEQKGGDAIPEMRQQGEHPQDSCPLKNETQQSQKWEGTYKEDKIHLQDSLSDKSSDTSRASRKPIAKAQESAHGANSQNGKPKTAEPEKPRPGISELSAEIEAIRGEKPTTRIVESVLTALGSASVAGFVRHLHEVNFRYRPGGAEAVGAWAWFVSTASSFADAENMRAENPRAEGLDDALEAI